MRKINRTVALLIPILLFICFFSLGRASATCAQGQQSCSATYGIGRYSFDSGGSLDTTCSTSYCAAQTLGDTGVGNSASSNYQVQAGFNVNRQPSLEMTVNTTSINMGVLSTSSTATAMATFSVESYLSSGYVVITDSPPPQYSTHTISAPSSATASAAGTEQFGINLVANTSPTTFGANPVQIPNSSYSYGAAASGYNTPNQYAYVNGATIAESSKSSGQTNYTISYILNISSVTPAGTYQMNQVLIATPTF